MATETEKLLARAIIQLDTRADFKIDESLRKKIDNIK